MGQVSAIDLAVIIVYVLGVVGLGCWFMRKGKTTEDFFLGGRRLPWWAVGLSIFGTQLSAITFMAIPARAFMTDWTWLVGNFTILVMAPVIAWVFLPFFRRVPITSAYEYLESRFHPRVRDYGGVAFMLMQLGRMGVVLYLPALALAEVTGLSVVAMIVVVGLLIIVYTMMGGIEAVIWTDVVQVVILLGGAVFTVVLIVVNIEGGFGKIIEIGAAENKFRLANLSASPVVDALWLVILGNLFTQLIPYGSDQTVIQRYLTTKTEKEARRSILLNGLMSPPAGLLFFFLGTALFAYYKVHPTLPAGLNMDRVYPYFIVTAMPVGVAGLVIAAVFAASMSSLDSSLNSVATVCVNDFYRRYIRPDAPDARCLKMARVLTVVWGLAAIAVATLIAQWSQAQGAWHTFTALLGLLGGGLAGVFVLGIFVPRATWQGAIAGVLYSIGALAIATYLPIYDITAGLVRDGRTLHVFSYPIIAIVTCVAFGTAFSLLFKPRPSDETAPFTWWGMRRSASQGSGASGDQA